MESRTYKSRQARLRSVAEPTPPGTAVGPARQYQTQMNPSMQGHRRSRGSVASKELKKKPSQTELEVNPLPPIRGKYQTSGPGASSELLNHTVNINIVNPITVIPNNPAEGGESSRKLSAEKISPAVVDTVHRLAEPYLADEASIFAFDASDPRPVVNTFFAIRDGQTISPADAETLAVWRRAWDGFGWNPVSIVLAKGCMYLCVCKTGHLVIYVYVP